MNEFERNLLLRFYFYFLINLNFLPKKMVLWKFQGLLPGFRATFKCFDSLLLVKCYIKGAFWKRETLYNRLPSGTHTELKKMPFCSLAGVKMFPKMQKSALRKNLDKYAQTRICCDVYERLHPKRSITYPKRGQIHTCPKYSLEIK